MAAALTIPDVEIIAMQPVATALFALAVVHTFAVKHINAWAGRFREGSVGENLLHFLGEIEVVFGLWAAALVAAWAARYGTNAAVAYVESIDYTEAGFVFVIMCMAATRPVLYAASLLIRSLARLMPIPRQLSLYAVTLVVGPLLGSLITEPAAMTVTALLLKDQVFGPQSSTRLKYATLGLLFVNVSIGGTLTHFAAPPVLMVAGPWGWSTSFMLLHLGWKAAAAVVASTALAVVVFGKELRGLPDKVATGAGKRVPLWIAGAQFAFMGLTIFNSHYLTFIMALFLFFVGWCAVTREYQDELRIRESLLVGFFLGGLVTLGKLQAWWLQPLLSDLGTQPLFWGAVGLTAVTDNAALTYLGTLVPGLSDTAKYMLVAGAVTGGGLTVIANAPNPAGYGILQGSFGTDGISPLYLFLGALPFTLIAALSFLLL